jgi:tetrahydromethanopterin S-methyltransferase subunit G
MPATDEKVNTTLREVIGDTVTQASRKSDDKNSQQTDSGAKREFISGIDVTDIPDNMTKAEFKDFLAKKGKLLEDGYTPKFKEIAEFKKERDEIVKLGVTPQKAREIILESLKNNETKGDVKKELKREIDQLKEEAPDLETRKGVERLERIIMELSKSSPEYKELKDRLDKAEKALGYVTNKTLQTRTESLNEALDKLSGEKFDKNFIEKYRERIIDEGKKYPDADVKKIIQVISDPDDYNDAILKTKKQEETKKERLKEKINASDSTSSGVTGSEKAVDLKNTSLKNVLRQVFTKK